MIPTAHEERALAEFSVERLLEFLKQLVAVPSLGEGTDEHAPGSRESAAQILIQEAMERIGLTTDLWSIDLEALAKHPDFSAEIERSEALGLVGTLEGCDRDGRRLILNGHIDVVPAGDLSQWPTPPFEAHIHDGLVSGRGALDMKGGLCCGLFALDAIIKAKVPLRGSVHLESVVGEEDGGLGTLATCLRGYRADGAIIMEPTNLEITRAHAGCANFRLTVPGLSAHGCFRDEGVSAIEKFALVHRALLDFELDYNRRHPNPLFARVAKPYPLSIGTLRAGNWPSSVPDSLVAEGRFGVATESSLADAQLELENVLAQVNSSDPWLLEHPATIEWWGGQFEPATTDESAAIVGVLADAIEATTGAPPATDAATYGADMRLLVHQAQTPTVMFGPGDVRLAHGPLEAVPIAHLETVSRALIRTIVRFCGVAAS
jgi:acetylornithine deacetylase